MAPYRILVVDDSAFMRKLFTDIIESDPSLTVIATADNGRTAVELHERLQPDAVTLDLEMPLMNGLEALRDIMANKPVPVIMLSGISEENTRGTIAALQLGAFDFIRKPSGLSADIDQVAEALLIRLRLAVKIHKDSIAPLHARPRPKAVASLEAPPVRPAERKRTVKEQKPEQREASGAAAAPREPGKRRKPEAGTSDKQARKQTATDLPPSKKERPPDVAARGRPAVPGTRAGAAGTSFRHVIAVGTSTGGPRALHQLISALPGDLPAPVLIVQHMPPKFTHSLAQRLDSFSQLAVKEAEHDETIRSGTVYIAPGGYHMLMAKHAGEYRIKLTLDEPRSGHRPSVDELFESLVPLSELTRHAVIMTGMGSDGAKGMKLLAEQGAATTIAESEDTCVVYGMPRAAVEAGAAMTVLPLHDIASELSVAVMKKEN